jgi:hypothetical protein
VTTPAAYTALVWEIEMEIQVQVKGIAKASLLRRLAMNKLNLAMESYRQVIERIVFQIDDVNGPERGGIDKLGRLVIRLKDSSVWVIEDLGADAARVIDRVVERAIGKLALQMKIRAAAPA